MKKEKEMPTTKHRMGVRHKMPVHPSRKVKESEPDSLTKESEIMEKEDKNRHRK